jgi:hypothetical protein
MMNNEKPISFKDIVDVSRYTQKDYNVVFGHLQTNIEKVRLTNEKLEQPIRSLFGGFNAPDIVVKNLSFSDIKSHYPEKIAVYIDGELEKISNHPNSDIRKGFFSYRDKQGIPCVDDISNELAELYVVSQLFEKWGVPAPAPKPPKATNPDVIRAQQMVEEDRKWEKRLREQQNKVTMAKTHEERNKEEGILVQLQEDFFRDTQKRYNGVRYSTLGGQIPHYATGGQIPGYGGGDRRLVMVEDGEYIVNKESTKKYKSILEVINNDRSQ